MHKYNYTLVTLHKEQVFRILLKTLVEKNANDLNPLLAGFAFWQSPVSLSKVWGQPQGWWFDSLFP